MIDKNDVTIQLYLKNELVAEYNNETGEVEIHKPELLPPNMRNVSGRTPIMDATKKQMAFQTWCQNRILSIDRSHAKKILNALQLPQSEDGKFVVSMACHSVSQTDCYWTKMNVETDLNWENINLYHNSFSKAICHIALTGESLTITNKNIKTAELTGLGAYAKAWMREDDGIYLYKADGEQKCESKIEVEVSNILDCFNVDHVKYENANYEDMYVCKCKCIADENTSIITAEHFSTLCNRQEKDFKSAVLEIDKENYYKMLVVDYLIGNTDRHIQNWGFFMDNESGEIKGLHPLFDHNNGFDNEALDNEDFPSIVESGKTMKEAAEYAAKRCDIHLVKPLDRSLFMTTKHYNTFVKRCKQLGISLELEQTKSNTLGIKPREKANNDLFNVIRNIGKEKDESGKKPINSIEKKAKNNMQKSR